MTIEVLYKKIGGDYSEILDRLESPEIIEKYIIKFLKDDSFKKLNAAIRERKRADAFRAAHTLKGVCLNLSLGALLLPVNKLTEDLRREDSEISVKTEKLLGDVKCEYTKTIKEIKAYIKESAR